MVYVGVDPAFRDGGFAVAIIDMRAKTLSFRTMQNVFEWYEFVKNDLSAKPDVFVCIEDSSKQNLTFKMSGTRETLARLSRNVGCNQAVSSLAVFAAKKFLPKGRVFALSPREKGAKIQSAATFLAFVKNFGVEIQKKGAISQDERDAAKLAMMIPTQIRLRNALR